MILQTHRAISPGVTASFAGSGGTAPYTYAIAATGSTSGGSIDASGIYTPGTYGMDIIEVTDSSATPIVEQATIAVLRPLELVCDIIQREMGLADGDVYVYNQKFNIPKDGGVNISVGSLSPKAFGVSKRHDGSGAGLTEIQSVNMRDILDINIFSKSMAAFDRKEEIILALNSDYAETQQETNSFKIGRIPSNFVNLSNEDGAAIPYRFNISVPIQYYVKKVKAVDYYDNFQNVNVLTDK